MTQSLAGVEPLKAGCGDHVSPCLSECAAMLDPFAVLPDFSSAEIFQSAMADGVVAAGRTVSLKLPEVMNSVADVFRFTERGESRGPLNTVAGHVLSENGVSVNVSKRALPENGGSMNVSKRVLPEKGILEKLDLSGAAEEMDGAWLLRSGDATHSQVITEKEFGAKDALPGQLVGASELDPKGMSLAQDPFAGSSVPLDRVESLGTKNILPEPPDAVGDGNRKTEVRSAHVGSAVLPKPPKVKGSVVDAFKFTERRESLGHFSVEHERVMPENGVPMNVPNRILPEKGILERRDIFVSAKNQEGMPVQRHGEALSGENIVRSHEMPSDGHEPMQVIAPSPLPIELPAATVRQEPAVSVVASDVVRMFVAAAEAVADAILVSSGFENGEGRILVRLQPEVLGGSEIQITVKGGTLTVVVNPASQDVQTIVEANRTQFEQHLAEKVHSWRVAVAVRRGDKTNERV